MNILKVMLFLFLISSCEESSSSEKGDENVDLGSLSEDMLAYEEYREYEKKLDSHKDLALKGDLESLEIVYRAYVFVLRDYEKSHFWAKLLDTYPHDHPQRTIKIIGEGTFEKLAEDNIRSIYTKASYSD